MSATAWAQHSETRNQELLQALPPLWAGAPALGPTGFPDELAGRWKGNEVGRTPTNATMGSGAGITA